MKSLLLMGVFVLVVPPGAGATELTGLAHAIDGDTILVGPRHVRLEGIDAPEMSQVCEDTKGHAWPCGKASRDRLAELVDGRDVRCAGAVKDAYGRFIATCRVDGSDVERTLVAEGLAWAFRKYSATYIAEEDKARSAGIGIWAGRAEPPWEYRAPRSCGRVSRRWRAVAPRRSSPADRIPRTCVRSRP